MDSKTAKAHLDTVIKKARVHFYKPIQIAEILHRDRIDGDIDLADLETYRTPSRKWRDEISLKFTGRVSTSTAKYQDDLFNPNATPPAVLVQLGKTNRSNEGAVEAYIYTALKDKLSQMSLGLSVVSQANAHSFELRSFIDSFRRDPGLSRSVDKIFEIVVYALFSTLLEVLEVKVGLQVGNINETILSEFSDFTEKVLGLSNDMSELYQDAKVYRVGVTNAADTGLDMWANFGAAFQIKHISLTPKVVEDISHSISADRIIVVCKESEKDVLVSVLKQFGGSGRIQSIITEDELEQWYAKALRGQSAKLIGNKILQKLVNEIKVEFPSTTSGLFEDFFKERGYDYLGPVNVWPV